ncbi:MAG: right-handed parallel beta-helix repeat-containing protein [Candidatus Thermoplasmatota archaeon]|nr:right-handed parallel beta-helix repeat-containing protein [Candidatus Thermoplasmatota archaeon]
MILSSFAVAFGSSVVTLNTSERYSPQGNTGGAYVGDLTIYANGTVNNPSLVSITGHTYTLLSDLNGTVTIRSNNTVFNGNGYTVNGRGSIALESCYVNGLAIENLMVRNSTTGIYFYLDTNSVVMNDTLIGSSTLNENFVDISHSSDVSVKYSNFLLNSTVTRSYGIYAGCDASVNVSHNKFSGATYYDFVDAYAVGLFSAWGNTIMSTDSSSYAFYVECGGAADMGYNYANHTEYGMYFYWQEYATTTHNQFYNTSYGLYYDYVTTVRSYHDRALYSSSAAIYMEYSGNGLIQYGNFSDSYYGAELCYDANVTIANSNLSAASEYAVYTYDGANLNLYNDMLRMSPTSTYYSIYTEYMSGWVNLSGDTIYMPSGTGVYLYYSPHFNVFNSYINATDNIYADTSVLGATISNNTMETMNGGYTFYMYGYSYFFNFVFTNNTVKSPGSKYADYGVYAYSCYASNNVLIKDNTFSNSDNSVYVYFALENGGSVSVQNNTFLNTTEAIQLYYYSTVQVTGNYIHNVTDIGICVEVKNGQLNLSYNKVQDKPGSAGFSYGIIAYYGNAVVSHNTVLNGGSSSDGIYIFENIDPSVYDNYVNHTNDAFYIYENSGISFFDNGADNSTYGLYSYYNHNLTYFGNTFSNDNYSLESCLDFIGSIFANNFVDSQSNSHSLYFLYLYKSYGNLTFYHNNFLNETVNSTIHDYYVPNQQINMNAPFPVGGNYWSNYTGSGYIGIGTTPMPVAGSLVDYYPLTSMWTSPTVTFVETGLPVGTSWSVSMNSALKSSTSGTIVYSLTNGFYMKGSYLVSNVPGYVASKYFGTVAQDDKNVVITVAFTPYTYNVTFTESNLHAGTTWSVTLNGNTESSGTSAISFSVSNGTYNYSIGSVLGYHTASAGNLTVDGASLIMPVTFQQNEYILTVKETGLPAGYSWMFNFNGTQLVSFSDIISIQTASGTYTVSATGPSGYSVSLSPSVTVSNENTTFSVTFSAIPEYTLLVTETGLSSGSSWTFILNGHTYTTNLSALNVQVTAGSYTINASGPSGYTVTLKATSVTVTGNTTLTVSFSSQHASSSGSIYEGLGIGVVVGGAVAALGVMFATGTGIFRNMKKGAKSP